MTKAAQIALAALVGVFLGVPAASAQSWEAINSKDAITDEIAREVCSTQSQFRLCMTFKDNGMWVRMSSLGTDLFDSQLFPVFRIDQNAAFEFVTPDILSAERLLGYQLFPRTWQPSYVTWRAQVLYDTDKRTDSTPPLLVRQMISGRSLLVRVYLSGGFQKDVTYSLAGFCTAAAKVYDVTAPPLSCPQ